MQIVDSPIGEYGLWKLFYFKLFSLRFLF